MRKFWKKIRLKNSQIIEVWKSRKGINLAKPKTGEDRSFSVKNQVLRAPNLSSNVAVQSQWEESNGEIMGTSPSRGRDRGLVSEKSGQIQGGLQEAAPRGLKGKPQFLDSGGAKSTSALGRRRKP